MTSPTREEWKAIADLIAHERHTRERMAALSGDISDWAALRRHDLLELHRELGTWQKVADATGQKLAAIHKAAKQPKRGTTP
jgi:hypothetical protein